MIYVIHLYVLTELRILEVEVSKFFSTLQKKKKTHID